MRPSHASSGGRSLPAGALAPLARFSGAVQCGFHGLSRPEDGSPTGYARILGHRRRPPIRSRRFLGDLGHQAQRSSTREGRGRTAPLHQSSSVNPQYASAASRTTARTSHAPHARRLAPATSSRSRTASAMHPGWRRPVARDPRSPGVLAPRGGSLPPRPPAPAGRRRRPRNPPVAEGSAGDAPTPRRRERRPPAAQRLGAVTPAGRRRTGCCRCSGAAPGSGRGSGRCRCSRPRTAGRRPRRRSGSPRPASRG